MVNPTHGLKKSLLLATCTLLIGCAGTKPEKPTVSTGGTEDETPEGSFVPLETARTMIDLPYLVDLDGIVETQCFEKVEGVSASPAGEEVSDSIDSHSKAVMQSIGNWMIQDLELDGLDDEMLGGWQVEVGDPQVAVIQKENLRFEKEQTCIGKRTANLPKGVDAVISLIGAREFQIESSDGIGADVREKMIAAFGAKNVIMDSDEVFEWNVALDEKGEPQVDKNGEELYPDPDGKLIPESELPAESDRGMKRFRLRSETPIYFAYAAMTDEYWRREGKKKTCDVFLVWGDTTLREPDCEEFQESEFSVQKKDEDVEVTVRTDGKKKKVVLPYNKIEMVQINDRIILWLRPKQIEEGVLLQLNSLVLSPRPMAETPDPAPMPAAAPVSAPATAIRESEPEPTPSKPKKTPKKGKKTDQQSVDDYISG